MKDTLIDFLRTGKLSFLELGVDISQVHMKLNDLESKLVRRTKKIKSYNYDDLSIHFENNKLDVISLFCKKGVIYLPQAVIEEGKFEIDEVDYNEFVNLLSKEGIDYELHPWSNTMFVLRLGTGVHVYFDSEKLYSIEFYGRKT